MKISNEFKAGLIAVIAIALLIFGYNFLKGENLLSKSRHFYVLYDDVEGLSPSSVITINGLHVGNVSDIRFSDETGKILVTLNVKSDFQFSKYATAKIYGGDLIGGKSMAIVPVYPITEVAKDGDTLVGEIEDGLLELVNNKLTPLQTKVESAVVGIDSLVHKVNFILDLDTQNTIKQSIGQFEETLLSLKGTTEKLNQMIASNEANIETTVSNFSKISEQFLELSESIAEADIKQNIINLNESITKINEMLTKTAEGEGNLGKLVNDELLYDNIEAASKQMEKLLEDFRLNPKRYIHFSIFGKKHVPYTHNKLEDKEENKEK